MADPAPLRKSNELLAKLMQQHGAAHVRFGRNPVWLLLKGLEGFDTERASECLVKLFSKRYDTISVLKLATKRDLVDDAGILPGDALRIVAAAEAYDAPCDPSPGPTSQCGPGGKRSLSVIQGQPQKVLKQNAGLRQEAVKEGKVVDQVGPNQEAATRQLIPPRISYPHICRTCNAVCRTYDQFRSHYNGQKHYAALTLAIQSANTPKAVNPTVKETKEVARPEQAASALMQLSQSTPIAASLHACGVCNVQCGSKSVLRSHFEGNKHADEMQTAIDSDDNRPTQYLSCSICNVTVTAKTNLVEHLLGKRHADNLKKNSDS